MVKRRWLDRLYWHYFAKPASDREVYRFLLNHSVSSILEIGVGTARRTKNLLTLVDDRERMQPLRYVGVDQFEAATDTVPHIRLKDLHRMLAERCVKGYLMPGRLKEALPRLVRNVHPSELVIIDGGWSKPNSDGQALLDWLPRLAAPDAVVFACSDPGTALSRIPIPMQSVTRAA